MEDQYQLLNENYLISLNLYYKISLNIKLIYFSLTLILIDKIKYQLL